MEENKIILEVPTKDNIDGMKKFGTIEKLVYLERKL